MRFRPHHFLCTLSFQGLGYSSSFVENYLLLKKTLVENEEILIEVVEAEGDSICGTCPHLQGDKTCETEAKIKALDHRHATALNLRAGDRLSWREAKERMCRHMTIESFQRLCEGCSWQSLGVCEQALKDLLASPPSCKLPPKKEN